MPFIVLCAYSVPTWKIRGNSRNQDTLRQ
jgi:hypothetical protein